MQDASERQRSRTGLWQILRNLSGTQFLKRAAVHAMRHLNLILLAVALCFMFAMLRGIGWSNPALYIRQVGSYAPLILVPYGVSTILAVLAWRVLLPMKENRPTLWRLCLLRLGGESLNQLTPTASLGGEPFKALHLQADGVPWHEAVASLVIQKGLLVLSLVLYILIAIALVPFVLPDGHPRLGSLLLGVFVLGGLGVTFVVVQRSNPCSLLVRCMKRLGLTSALARGREADLETLDALLAGFYRAHPGRILAAFSLFFLSWSAQSAEVFLIFTLMGHPLGWGVAFCLDGLAMLFTGLGFMIPVSLGVQDGGNLLLALGFRLGATLGVAFSIIRRIREAAWLVLGLVVVAKER
jgi:uncharacterized membrane protein YbhN (UPF0104 family)